MKTQDTAATPHTKRDSTQTKKDADYVFYELTRSICPECRRVIDAQILLRDNKVYMRKRCPQCGPFEALVYADAEAYTAFGKYNKPGTIPLAHGSEIHDGCPYDCGLCPKLFNSLAVNRPSTHSSSISFEPQSLVVSIL